MSNNINIDKITMTECDLLDKQLNIKGAKFPYLTKYYDLVKQAIIKYHQTRDTELFVRTINKIYKEILDKHKEDKRIVSETRVTKLRQFGFGRAYPYGKYKIGDI